METASIVMLGLGVVVGAAGGFGASRLRGGAVTEPVPGTEQADPDPATEQAPESATESAPETATEPAPETATEPAPETATEPAPETATESAAPAPATESAPESEEGARFEDSAGFEIAVQRRALIDVCIGIADRLRDNNEALWGQLTDGLAAAGVSTVTPDGQPFDPEQHVSVLVEPTEDEELHQTVAATGTVGYLDGTTWLRRAEVAVYQQTQQP